jgi:glycosyltransferase involved in cell wall biosynthesis
MKDKISKRLKKLPFVSVITICKNSEKTLRRCMDSVLNQDYPHFEYIIQDGVSTDRTLDIIREYQDDRIELISEKDSGGSEAYFKALRRCSGEIITLCWADEELLSHAVGWGVENLKNNPDAGAIYGDVYCTDIDGNIYEHSRPAPPWNLSKYLCWEMMPNYCASFVRRKALEESGFFEFTSSFMNAGKTKLEEANCIMYDYFALVGIRHPIIHVPGYVGKFSVHSGQLSSNPKVLFGMIPGLIRSIDNICDLPRLPLAIRTLRRRAYAGIHLAMIHTLLNNAEAYDDAKVMLQRAMTYDPDTEFLNKVLHETGETLLYRGKNDFLLECLKIVESKSSDLSDFYYFYSAALLEGEQIDASKKAICKGLSVRPSDHRLQLLDNQLNKQIERENWIKDKINANSHNTMERLYFDQLLHFVSLKGNRKKRRMGQIMNSGFSSGTMLAAADILYRAMNSPNFANDIVKTSAESCRLVEKTLAAYLYLMVENNAMEAAQRLSEQIAKHYALKRNGSEMQVSTSRPNN